MTDWKACASPLLMETVNHNNALRARKSDA